MHHPYEGNQLWLTEDMQLWMLSIKFQMSVSTLLCMSKLINDRSFKMIGITITQKLIHQSICNYLLLTADHTILVTTADHTQRRGHALYTFSLDRALQ